MSKVSWRGSGHIGTLAINLLLFLYLVRPLTIGRRSLTFMKSGLARRKVFVVHPLTIAETGAMDALLRWSPLTSRWARQRESVADQMQGARPDIVNSLSWLVVMTPKTLKTPVIERKRKPIFWCMFCQTYSETKLVTQSTHLPVSSYIW